MTLKDAQMAEDKAHANYPNGNVMDWHEAARVWRRVYDLGHEYCEQQAKSCELIAESILAGDRFRATHEVCLDCQVVVENGKPHDCHIPSAYGVHIIKDKVI